MSNNSKNIMLGVLAVGVIAMTVAFAALSTNLRINGTASVPNTNWNIHFSGWALDTASTVTEGGVTHQNTASYPTVAQLTQSLSPNVTLVEGLNITLYQPGDYAKYTFNIVNDGTIDAQLDNFTHTMTCESGKNCDFLEYTVECKDSQLNTVTQNTVLPKNGGSVSCYLQLKFKDVDNLGANTNQANNLQASIVNGVYTQEATSATLAANWIWGQASASQAQGGGNSGGNEPVTPSNPNETTFDGNYTYASAGSGFETNEYGFVPLDFNNEWNVYLRNDGTKNETCNVFPTGTVCMTSSYYNGSYSGNGYYSDFENVSSNNVTTVAGLQATGLKGYSLAKAEEMLNKGASSCDVGSDDVYCGRPAGGYCYINNGGYVYCYDGSNYCDVYYDGSVDCN